MKLLICITGTTGSGKSTLLDSLALRGWHTLSTGAIFRRMKRSIEDSDSTHIAPESFDLTVYDEIGKFLSKSETGGPCLCAVEAFPRKPEQIMELKRIGERKGWIVICLALNATLEIRKARIAGRCLTDEKRADIDIVKIREEEDTWPSFTTTLKECGVPLFDVDTSSSQRSLFSGHLTIAHMMEVVANYYHHRTGSRLTITALTSMVQGIRAEAEEVLDSCTDSERIEELIDVMWYTMCSLAILGATPEYVSQMFNNKASVNFHRMATGSKPHVHNFENEEYNNG